MIRVMGAGLGERMVRKGGGGGGLRLRIMGVSGLFARLFLLSQSCDVVKIVCEES